MALQRRLGCLALGHVIQSGSHLVSPYELWEENIAFPGLSTAIRTAGSTRSCAAYIRTPKLKTLA
jgi:hypothetical protein